MEENDTKRYHRGKMVKKVGVWVDVKTLAKLNTLTSALNGASKAEVVRMLIDEQYDRYTPSATIPPDQLQKLMELLTNNQNVLNQYLTNFRNIGNNLNQIAKYLNTTKGTEEIDIEELQNEVNDLYLQILKLTKEVTEKWQSLG